MADAPDNTFWNFLWAAFEAAENKTSNESEISQVWDDLLLHLREAHRNRHDPARLALHLNRMQALIEQGDRATERAKLRSEEYREFTKQILLALRKYLAEQKGTS